MKKKQEAQQIDWELRCAIEDERRELANASALEASQASAASEAEARKLAAGRAALAAASASYQAEIGEAPELARLQALKLAERRSASPKESSRYGRRKGSLGSIYDGILAEFERRHYPCEFPSFEKLCEFAKSIGQPIPADRARHFKSHYNHYLGSHNGFMPELWRQGQKKKN
jgi:hypothetical protein